jgi:hypothetical protein
MFSVPPQSEIDFEPLYKILSKIQKLGIIPQLDMIEGLIPRKSFQNTNRGINSFQGKDILIRLCKRSRESRYCIF